MDRSPTARTILAVTLTLVSACGGGSTTAPNPAPAPTTAIPPTAPPPTTATPPPPGPAPTPASQATLQQLCGSPLPGLLVGVRVKVHADNGDRKILDSKPLVANTDNYCGKVGISDSAQFCETRLEGSGQREYCDQLAVGKAKDTARWGPTWSVDGHPCVRAGTCENHPENQFLLVTRGAGNFLACAADEIRLADGGSRCGGLQLR